MRIFRSGRSKSQTPPQTDSGSRHAFDDTAPVPKSSRRIREFFRRPQKPPQASFRNVMVAPSSPHPLEPGTSRQVQDVPGSAAHDFPSHSPSPSSHSSQFIAPPIPSNVAHTPRPAGPVPPPSVHLASPSPPAGSEPRQHQDRLALPQPSPATVSQQSLLPPGPTVSPRQPSPQLRDRNSYQLHAGQDIWMFQEERNLHVGGENNNVTYMINSSNTFMDRLLQETIQGAAVDSSARDPPPRCHPGTRLAVLDRCLKFITNHDAEKKMLWLVGRAGVGKSAIMQNVAESTIPSVSKRASIFLSVNGRRNDGSKLIMTLVYQLAAQCEPYRQCVEHEITRDPALLQSTMSVQFNKFIVEPFVNTHLSYSVGHILIIVDGLDECDKPEAQRELLELITNICSAHPSSPIVWIIASRPEYHITSFFARDNIQAVYEKEEVLVDSDEARADTEKFLRDELTRIQKEFSLGPRWPPEQDLWKLASASGGLFVYAHTAVKYIGALAVADPVSQLDDVLKVIDAQPLHGVAREQHPMALLDALYARILSRVSERVMVNTRKILLALVLDLRDGLTPPDGGFPVLCNWLGMTCDEAYAAIRHLGSVLDAPTRDRAFQRHLRSFHKSFTDYLSDFTRSGFSTDIVHEARQLNVQCTIRIFEQAPRGIDSGNMNRVLRLSSGDTLGTLAHVRGAGSSIVLSWSADDDRYWSNTETRFEMYKMACWNLIEGIRTGQSVFCTEFYTRTIITQLVEYSPTWFPYQRLIDSAFEKSRRHGFIKSGLLKRVPIDKLDFTRMIWNTKLQFRCPAGTISPLSNPWNPSCVHKRAGDRGEGKDEDWTTEFDMDAPGCHFCRRRLGRQLRYWKTRFPDHDVTILFTSAQVSFLEFQFIDPDDGASEWTYWITLKTPGAQGA